MMNDKILKKLTRLTTCDSNSKLKNIFSLRSGNGVLAVRNGLRRVAKKCKNNFLTGLTVFLSTTVLIGFSYMICMCGKGFHIILDISYNFIVF